MWSILLSISPVTGALSATIVGGNATHGSKLFTESGTFTVPDGVNTLRVTAIGGGGGGNTTIGGGGISNGSGQYGEDGKVQNDIPIFVSPNQQCQVTIGRTGGGGYKDRGSGGYGGSGNPAGKTGTAGTKYSWSSGGGGGSGGCSNFAGTIIGGAGNGGAGSYHPSGTNYYVDGGVSPRRLTVYTDYIYFSSSYGRGGAPGYSIDANGNDGHAGTDGCVYVRW